MIRHEFQKYYSELQNQEYNGEKEMLEADTFVFKKYQLPESLEGMKKEPS